MNAWMSLNVGQILPMTTELAAIEHLKYRCHRFFSVSINSILFKFAGSEDMHNIFDELRFDQIRPPTRKFAALGHQKKIP